MPRLSEGRGLREDVHDVRGAICNVRPDRQLEQGQTKINGDFCPGQRITHRKINKHDRGQHQVIRYAARFPELDCIGRVFADVESGHGMGSHRIESHGTEFYPNLSFPKISFWRPPSWPSVTDENSPWW
jgi:hypothetical protein